MKIDSLSKAFGKKPILKEIDLTIQKGKLTAFIGPNGAGKTTSFYMVVGLVNMDQGQIQLGQQNLSALSMHERAKAGIGYLPQEASIFRKLTVEENILSILQMRTDLDKKQQLQQLEQLIGEFNLGHVRHSLGMSVSGGERRRCEIARSLASNPKFILLDEPFAGVDPISVGDIKEVIIKLKQRGIGVLITDHNVRETLAICEHAYIVSEGQIIAEGSSEHILENELVRKVYLGENFVV